MPTLTPTLTLGLNNFSAEAPDPATGWELLLRRAELADAAGIDRLVVVDHVVMGADLGAYDGGRFPTGPEGHWLEPLTLLGVLAGRTSRIRLSTGILIAALRRPVVLAKALATLDVLSRGRVDLGVGIGWQAKEYEAAGLDFSARGQLLDETLAVLAALWAPGPGPAAGTFGATVLDGVWCEPKPLQPGGVPIWVSGRVNARTLRRIVTHGAGWIPWGEHLADVGPGAATVRAALADAGRDPDAFAIRSFLPVAHDPDGVLDPVATMAKVGPLREAGVTDFALNGRWPDGDAEQAHVFGALVESFRAATT